MTWKYWLKIVAGMLVIFAIGAYAVRTVRHGEAFINSDRAIDIPMLGASFKLGGQSIGKIQRMRIERSSPRSVSGVALTVRLDDSMMMSRFDGCSLAITDASSINKNTTFVCTIAADSTRLKLVPFGTVTFNPGNHQVVLLVPQSVVVDLQHSFAGNKNSSTNVNADSGSLHVRINGKDIVSIQGDSVGGSIKVFDGKGRAIVDIAGDSSGGHVVVKDSTGRTKVDVKGTNPPRKPNSP